MEPTIYDIYRNPNREYSFHKEDPSYELLHPDDTIEVKTELHIFSNPDAAERFEKELEKTTHETEAEITWQSEHETPDGKSAIFVEYHDQEHPTREIIEINHD